MPTRSSSSNRSKSTVPNQKDTQGSGAENAESREKNREANAVGSFLRGLARRAESDSTFAVHLHSALEESGLLESLEGSLEPGSPAGRESGRKRRVPHKNEEKP